MTSRERITRPQAERTEPFRDWQSTLKFDESGHSPERGNSDTHASDDGETNDDVAAGVDLGYRVIEEQLEAGRRLAAGYAPDIASLWADSGLFSGAGVSQYIEFLNQLTSMTIGLLGATTNASAAETDFAPEVSASPVTERDIGIYNIQSPRPVRLRLEIVATEDDESFHVHHLCAIGSGIPPLTRVALRYVDEGELMIELAVPVKAAAGRYVAAVTSAVSNIPLGTLCVELLD